MTDSQTEKPDTRKPLRLWPGVVAVALLWLVRFVVPIVVPGAMVVSVLGGLAGGLVVLVWWLFFSRAPWSERLGAVLLMIAALFATSRIVHESIATGAQRVLPYILAIPVLSLAFVVSAVVSRRLSVTSRRVTMAAAILLACGSLTLVRTGGFTGDFKNDLHWRWTKTPEERLLTQASAEPPPAPVPAATAPDPAAAKTPEKLPLVKAGAELPPVPAATGNVVEWRGFRGPGRDGVLPGVRIKTDWSSSPPVKLWRRPIGPGWSSFAVRGEFIYTQEQRGPEEVVACYKLVTGEPVWTHRDTARFWESNGGPGPRSTPTLGNGRVYTFGATGVLNALNAGSGAVVWSRNAASDTKTKIPDWGFASSPLLFEDAVIVAVSGQLVAYDIATGTPRWFGPRGGTSYSSPHRLTAGGVEQILLLSATGATSVAPADGKVLWQHAWRGYPIVQPAVTADGDVLISVSERSGTRRLALAHGPAGWSVEERWTSAGLKPYFNDFVLHNGLAFGFDGNILACIDLKDGKRKWKGGRYGNGQLVLLPDQDLLLVLSEEGELALVRAASDQYTEIARFPAIEGKTWNHPVLAGDILLARNGEEMAAFKVSRPGR
ncbi:MAG: PQQ-binding-like beta-propeller repeat protein [Acidobacteria bacterium]|nr:PQQ-binding-like beta-propeller repeat protein [Acidobacteriota bacterium]